MGTAKGGIFNRLNITENDLMRDRIGGLSAGFVSGLCSQVVFNTGLTVLFSVKI